jgi:hypothetical protein
VESQLFSFDALLSTDISSCLSKVEDLQRALIDALRRGHVDFVELLIEFGTSLKKLTVHDLEQLYASASVRRMSQISYLRVPIRIFNRQVQDYHAENEPSTTSRQEKSSMPTISLINRM